MGRPNHLAVYLTNRCNLDCKYCYVAVNKEKTAALSFERLKRGVDFFFESAPAPDKKITFLGGEPFLNFPLLQRIVDYIRSKDEGRAVLQAFTNGTFLSQDKLDWLDSRQVFITVSLDGSKATNDRARVFYKGGGSVFDAVMERLGGVSKSNLGVSLVFDSRTVGGLLRNIDFFYKMGFSRITFNPELYEPWSQEDLRTLETAMSGFQRYYSAVLREGMRPFTVPILFSVLETEREGPGWWRECHNVVLGADGRFYSCDKALTFTFDRAAALEAGGAGAGMDWDKRGRDLAKAGAAVDKTLGVGRRQYFCPMGVVLYGGIAGTAPETLLENFVRVSDIFGGALERLARELKDVPAFQALYHNVHLV